MKQDYKKYTEANREAWNEAMPRHQAKAAETLDQLFAKPGYIVQTDKNLLQVIENINVKGKDIIHLCCNNGSELLSLKNMGARRCVGVDISDEAIREARERAKKCNIDCEFIRSDIFEIGDQFNHSFDIVQLTAGCIGWIPDLDEFFRIIANLLRKDGLVLIHEIHPFSETIPFDYSNVPNRLEIIEPYFRDEPIIETTGLDYVGGTEYTAVTHYWFVHTISTLVMALSKNGLAITHFSEHPEDISAGHYKQEVLNAGIPLSLILVGRK